MKRTLLLMLTLLIVTIVSAKRQPDFQASEFLKYSIDDIDGNADEKADFKAAALNIMANFGLDKDGNIGQTTIIECPGMSKQDVYAQARIWLEKFCSNDKASELRLDPAGGTTIIARKRLRNIASKEFCKIYKGASKCLQGRTVNLLVNIRVDIKDEKCRLETTIEDYGIYEAQNNGGAWANAAMSGSAGLIGAAIGSSISAALTKEKRWSPQYNYPFKEEYEPIPGEKKPGLIATNGKGPKRYFKTCIPTAALAYVTSFFVTQIVHDQMVEEMTSAPSYNNGSNGNDW